jgi:essential nuclear protein 1
MYSHSFFFFLDVEQDGDYIDARLEYLDDAHISNEEEIMKRFMPNATTERQTLADIIMAKMKEKEEGGGTGNQFGDEGASIMEGRPPLDPKIIEVYTEVGRFLSKYKSGKLPKVLKIVPGLSNWEEIIFLTNPETWTPHATNAITRIFASAFSSSKAQRFYALILLPKCRDDIYFHKRLNFHLYLALKKSTYKPAAFFKGIILALGAAGDCTLREAVIFASVISKMSLPQIHSAAALVKLASLPYNGAVSVFLKALVNKKYTLPYLAIDALAAHFIRAKTIPGPLPLIWHQALLMTVQRYRSDFTSEQKSELKDVLALHGHHAIALEIRRELFSAGCRGEMHIESNDTKASVNEILKSHVASAANATAAAAGPAAIVLAMNARGQSNKSKQEF